MQGRNFPYAILFQPYLSVHDCPTGNPIGVRPGAARMPRQRQHVRRRKGVASTICIHCLNLESDSPNWLGFTAYILEVSHGQLGLGTWRS